MWEQVQVGSSYELFKILLQIKPALLITAPLRNHSRSDQFIIEVPGSKLT